MRSPIIAAAFTVFAAAPVAAAPVCGLAAAVASRTTGTPLEIMLAVMHVESGGYPWILNIEGKGQRFSDPFKAIKAATVAVNTGKNVDVGCFQISTRWHGKVFANNLIEMISPLRNGIYAGLYLSDLKAQHGTWAKAIAYYHSADPVRGSRYLGAVVEELTRQEMRGAGR